MPYRDPSKAYTDWLHKQEEVSFYSGVLAFVFANILGYLYLAHLEGSITILALAIVGFQFLALISSIVTAVAASKFFGTLFKMPER